MDIQSVRSLHGVTWEDDLGWMESMKGEKWLRFIEEQQSRWNHQLNPLTSEVKEISKELQKAFRISHMPYFRAAGDSVEIAVKGSSIEWNWKGTHQIHQASDLVAHRGGWVWAVEDVGEGSELYAVKQYTQGNSKILWEQRGISPSVAIVGGRCYALESKNKLIYYRIVSWDAFTGKDKKVHYEETDIRYNLELLRGDENHAHVRRQAGGKQDIFVIDKHSPNTLRVLEGISLESRRFLLGSRIGEYSVWDERGWTLSPSLRRSGLRFPNLSKQAPESLDTNRGLLVTKWEGCRTLWKLSVSKEAYPLWQGWGQVLIDPWDSPWIRIVRPGGETVWWNMKKGMRPPPELWNQGGRCEYAVSNDGTRIPFYLLSTKQSKNLLVIGYGAYGLPTTLMTQRWWPLLQRGWAIAIGFWRGGGDHTPEWEDAGRVHGREKVLEDAEAVVRQAHHLTHISPSHTVLYGRSAGGLWVGGLVTKYAKGELAGGAYMEVPYLDVLRTTTNRSLPLTNIEADEFGLPEKRLSDLASILRWSPMERMPEEGIPGVVQLVRTGLNDSEVFPYESAKWIMRCKSKDAFLAVEGGQGHFVSGSTGREQQAEDLAFLLKKF